MIAVPKVDELLPTAMLVVAAVVPFDGVVGSKAGEAQIVAA